MKSLISALLLLLTVTAVSSYAIADTEVRVECDCTLYNPSGMGVLNTLETACARTECFAKGSSFEL